MKNTAHISLALAVGAFFVQPPPAAAGSPSLEQDRFAATGNLLCGLTLADVADIVDYYDFDPDMQTLADALATPFDCSAYGELCSEIEPADAQQVVRGAWND